MSVSTNFYQTFVLENNLQNIVWLTDSDYKALSSVSISVVRIKNDLETLTFSHGVLERIWFRCAKGVFLSKPGSAHIIGAQMSSAMFDSIGFGQVNLERTLCRRISDHHTTILPAQCTLRYSVKFYDSKGASCLHPGFVPESDIDAALTDYLSTGCVPTSPGYSFFMLNQPILLFVGHDMLCIKLVQLMNADGVDIGKDSAIYRQCESVLIRFEPHASDHTCNTSVSYNNVAIAVLVKIVWTASPIGESKCVDIESEQIDHIISQQLQDTIYLKGGSTLVWEVTMDELKILLRFSLHVENSINRTLYMIDKRTPIDNWFRATNTNIFYTSHKLAASHIQCIQFDVLKRATPVVTTGFQNKDVHCKDDTCLSRPSDSDLLFTPDDADRVREELSRMLTGESIHNGIAPKLLENVGGFVLRVHEIYPRCVLERHRLYRPMEPMTLCLDSSAKSKLEAIQFKHILAPLVRVDTREPENASRVVCELSIQPASGHAPAPNATIGQNATFESFMECFTQIVRKDGITAGGAYVPHAASNGLDPSHIMTLEEKDLLKPAEGHSLWIGKQITCIVQHQNVTITVKELVTRQSKCDSSDEDSVNKHRYAVWDTSETSWEWILATNTYIKIITPHKVPVLEHPLADHAYWEQKLKLSGLIPIIERMFQKISAMRHPEHMALLKSRGMFPERGLLLWGPPGTGKTKMARSLASLLGAKSSNVRLCNGPEMLSKWQGESEQNVRELFAPARKDAQLSNNPPLHVIIMDELEGVFPKRDSSPGSNGTKDNLVNSLMCELQGLHELNNVVFVGITNRKDMLDEALLRPGRIGWHEYIGLPSEDARLSILKLYATPWLVKQTTPLTTLTCLNSTEIDCRLRNISKQMHGYSGACIEAFVLRCIEEMWHYDESATQCVIALFEQVWSKVCTTLEQNYVHPA